MKLTRFAAYALGVPHASDAQPAAQPDVPDQRLLGGGADLEGLRQRRRAPQPSGGPVRGATPNTAGAGMVPEGERAARRGLLPPAPGRFDVQHQQELQRVEQDIAHHLQQRDANGLIVRNFEASQPGRLAQLEAREARATEQANALQPDFDSLSDQLDTVGALLESRHREGLQPPADFGIDLAAVGAIARQGVQGADPAVLIAAQQQFAAYRNNVNTRLEQIKTGGMQLRQEKQALINRADLSAAGRAHASQAVAEINLRIRAASQIQHSLELTHRGLDGCVTKLQQLDAGGRLTVLLAERAQIADQRADLAVEDAAMNEPDGARTLRDESDAALGGLLAQQATLRSSRDTLFQSTAVRPRTLAETGQALGIGALKSACNMVNNVLAITGLNWIATEIVHQHPSTVLGLKGHTTSWVAKLAGVISFPFIVMLRMPAVPRYDGASRGLPDPAMFRSTTARMAHGLLNLPKHQEMEPAQRIAAVATALYEAMEPAFERADASMDSRNAIRGELRNLSFVIRQIQPPGAQAYDPENPPMPVPGGLTIAQIEQSRDVQAGLDQADFPTAAQCAELSEIMKSLHGKLGQGKLMTAIDLATMGMHGTGPVATEQWPGTLGARVARFFSAYPFSVGSEGARGAGHFAIRNAMANRQIDAHPNLRSLRDAGGLDGFRNAFGGLARSERAWDSALGDSATEAEKEFTSQLVRVMRGQEMVPTVETQAVWGSVYPKLLETAMIGFQRMGMRGTADSIGRGEKFLRDTFANGASMRVRESLSHGLAPEIGDVRSVLASKIGAVETIAAMATVLTPAFTLYGWLVMAVAQTQPRLAHHNLTTGLPDGLQSTLLHNTMSRFGGNSVAMLSEHWVMNAVLRNTKMVATSVVALAAGLGNVSALGSAPMQRREAEVLDAGDALGAAVMRLDELGQSVANMAAALGPALGNDAQIGAFSNAFWVGMESDMHRLRTASDNVAAVAAQIRQTRMEIDANLTGAKAVLGDFFSTQLSGPTQVLDDKLDLALDGVALAQRAGYEVALRAGDVTNELLSVEPSRVQSLRHLDQLRHQGLQVARAVARRAATLATEPDAPQFTQFLVAVNRARDALEQIDASVARTARKERMVRALDVAALTVGMGTAVAGIAASAGAAIGAIAHTGGVHAAVHGARLGTYVGASVGAVAGAVTGALGSGANPLGQTGGTQGIVRNDPLDAV